jgi:hypothetical protein
MSLINPDVRHIVEPPKEAVEWGVLKARLKGK